MGSVLIASVCLALPLLAWLGPMLLFPYADQSGVAAGDSLPRPGIYHTVACSPICLAGRGIDPVQLHAYTPLIVCPGGRSFGRRLRGRGPIERRDAVGGGAEHGHIVALITERQHITPNGQPQLIAELCNMTTSERVQVSLPVAHPRRG